MKDSLVLLVLRVCSLFNLQGAMPSLFNPLPDRSVLAELHYNTEALACQALFSTFSKFLSSQLQAFIQAPALANFAILPRLGTFVKSFFCLPAFFFLLTPQPRRLSLKRSVILANHSLLVNPLFELFSHFFSSPEKTQDIWSFS